MLGALLRAELSIWFRTRENLFWSFAWPIAWLVLVWLVFPALPGRSKIETLEYYYPSGIALVLLSSTLTALALKLSLAKEQRELLRYRLVPMSMKTFFVAELLASSLLALVAIATFSAVSMLFGVRIDSSFWAALPILMLGNWVFASIAFFIAGVSQRVGQATLLAMISMFSIMFLSNMFFDLSLAPEPVWTISSFLPGTPLCDAMRAIMFDGESLWSQWKHISVLGGWATASSAIAIYTFKVS